MAAQDLKMAAKLVGADKFVSDLRKMKSELGDFAKTGQNVQKLDKNTKDLHERFKRFREQNVGVTKEFEQLKNLVGKAVPTFGALGDEIGGLAVGTGTLVGTVAALGAGLYETSKKLSEFSKGQLGMSYVAKESGLAVESVKRFELVLGDVGVGTKEAEQAIGQFGKSLLEFRAKQRTPFYEDLIHAPKDIMDSLKALQGDPQKFLEKLLSLPDELRKRFKDPLQGEQLGRRLIGEFFGDADIARLTGDIKKKMEELNIGPFAQMNDAAKEFHETWYQTELELDKLETAALLPVLKTAKELVEWVNKLDFSPFEKGIKDSVEEIQKLIGWLKWIDEKTSIHPPSMRSMVGEDTFDKLFGTGAPGGGTFAPFPPKGSATGGGHGPGAIGPVFAPLLRQFGLGGGGAGSAPGGGLGGFHGGGGGGGGGSGGDPRGLESFIRSEAVKNGIDPDVAMRVARSEGLGNPVGDRGTSFGAFQLHTGGGLGDEFKKQTGLDPSNPANERATIAWALKHAGQSHDWSPWHGAARVGIGRGQGFGYTGGPGGAGGGELTGVGGYNFMGSPRARAMGMGDVTEFSAAARMNFPTGIPKGEGPASVTANKYAGPDMAGFVKALHDAGAPLTQYSGVYATSGHIPHSQHYFGNAMDIETGSGSGPKNSPALYAWAQAHPKEFAAIQARYHMRNLDTTSGAGMHDWGHFEWTPADRAIVNGATKHTVSGTGHLSVDVRAPPGTNVKAKGGGIFRRVQTHRAIQMYPSSTGPSDVGGGGGVM